MRQLLHQPYSARSIGQTLSAANGMARLRTMFCEHGQGAFTLSSSCSDVELQHMAPVNTDAFAGYTIPTDFSVPTRHRLRLPT